MTKPELVQAIAVIQEYCVRNRTTFHVDLHGQVFYYGARSTRETVAGLIFEAQEGADREKRDGLLGELLSFAIAYRDNRCHQHRPISDIIADSQAALRKVFE